MSHVKIIINCVGHQKMYFFLTFQNIFIPVCTNVKAKNPPSSCLQPGILQGEWLYIVQVKRAQCDRVAPISTWPTGWSEKIITGYVNCNVQVITTEPRLLEGFQLGRYKIPHLRALNVFPPTVCIFRSTIHCDIIKLP